MSEIDANVVVDGQKTVAIIPQEGEIVKDGGAIDATCIVEDSNGKRHKAVKIVNIDDEPTDKSEIDAQILNNNNELITVTEEQEGEVITQDNSEIDFHCLVQKDDGKQLAVKTVEINGNIIKSGGAIDATCVVNAEGKNQLAVKVFKRGGGEIIETVYGTNSITFNAKANGLKALTLFGGTVQSNLPKGYTQYEYLRSSGTQYIDLGYKGNGNTKVKIKFRYHTATYSTGSGRVFGSRITSSRDAFAIGSASGIVSAEGTNKIFWSYDGQPYFVDDTEFGLDVWKTVVFSATEHTIDGVTVGGDYTVTEFETSNNLKLFGFDNNGTMGIGYVDIAYCQLWDNGVLVRDLVPASYGTTNSMYDRVSSAMLPNAGTGDFVAGTAVVPTPDAPMDIVSNNGTIKYSANMANVNAQTALIGYYISAQGAVLESAQNWIYQDFIPVSPNTTYTITMSSPVYFVSISEYLTASDSGFIVRDASGSGSHTTFTITTGANTHFVRFGANIDGSSSVTLDRVLAINWMLNKGNSLPYAPYSPNGIYTDGTVETVEVDTTGDTATAEMLLKVGNYQDTQEVLSGHITRKVGIKVLDGTENWVATTVTSGRLVFYVTKVSIGSDSTVLPSASSNIKCSHFKTSTAAAQSLYGTVWAGRTAVNFTAGDFCANLTAWKQWLANQYAAGTPVIIIYPLATPTTETVTGQTLTTKEGTNTISITQASISNLDLEAKYKKGSASGGTYYAYKDASNHIIYSKDSTSLGTGYTTDGCTVSGFAKGDIKFNNTIYRRSPSDDRQA